MTPEPPHDAGEIRLSGLARFGAVMSRAVSRVVPDPFVLALGITAVVWMAARMALSARGPVEDFVLVGAWYAELTSPAALAFTTQMALVLVTGHALALTGPFRRLVAAVAAVPRDGAHAAALVAFVSCAASVVHWGLGAVVGALVAREVARAALARGLAVHYPLLGAAAYSGFAVWHGGLSGSAPLSVTVADHRFAATIAESARYAGGVIPASATLGSSLNLVITSAMCLLIPVLFYGIAPRAAGACEPPRVVVDPTPARDARVDGWIASLQQRRGLNVAVGALGLIVLGGLYTKGQVRLDLNSIIVAFLFAGLLLHDSVASFSRAIADGAGGASAILIQFPFYFGILGLMKAGGLIVVLSDAMVSVSTPATFPALAFLSSGLVNLFIPSGGGQWVVQGEVLLRAGAVAGVDPATTVMAFAYGDAWTNLLQPFWALPVLGIMGLRARDIIGYTAMVCVVLGVLVAGLLLVMA